MKTLINTLTENNLGSQADFLFHLAHRLSNIFPAHDFVLLSEADVAKSDEDSPVNLKTIKVTHPTLFKALAQRKKLTDICRNEKPDAILTAHPVEAKNLPDQYWFPESHLIRQLSERKGVMEKTLYNEFETSAGVIVSSAFEKDFWTGLFPQHKNKITVIPRIPSEIYSAPNYNIQLQTKVRYTGGHEFFLCLPEDNKDYLMPVIKGFSGFKKWQKSNMHLFLTVQGEGSVEKINEMLRGYRFIDDVHVLSTENDEYLNVLSAAYAAIVSDKLQPNLDEIFKAVQVSTPLLAPDTGIASEILDTFFFPFQDGDKDDITRAMLEIFREEEKRAHYIRTAEMALKEMVTNGFYNRLFDYLQRQTGKKE